MMVAANQRVHRIGPKAGLPVTPGVRRQRGLMITANVIHRVFRIRCGVGSGTAFALDIDGKQYLVTAKHVLAGAPSPLRIDVFSNGNWADLPVTFVGHATSDIDISVLAADQRLTPSELPLEPTSSGAVYGQEVFFLGYPYGIVGKFLFGPGGFPLPLVKRATLSLFHGDVWLLDGHNNPGFSGGPVVFVTPGAKDFKVAGVISGFQATDEPVLAGGQPTPFVYRYNTGIIVCHMIDHAVALIKANPIGFSLN